VSHWRAALAEYVRRDPDLSIVARPDPAKEPGPSAAE